MTTPPADLYDVDARIDPFFAEYERARDALYGADWLEGVEEIERLAHRGSIMSILLVADAMRVGGWIYDQDLSGAEAWYRVAIDSVSARGLFGLGLTHLLMGRFTEAIGELEAAAEVFPPAYNALAGIYFRGDGVLVNKQKARQLWLKGSALGHLPARRNLCRLRLHGRIGFRERLAGLLDVMPLAFELVEIKASPYTDRMR